MNAKVMEIFKSIQGEGRYAGVPQVFLRFFECNMHCVWCDTPNSIGDTTRNFDELTLDQVLKDIKEKSDDCHSLSLTGGEPLIQSAFILALLKQLGHTDLKFYLETNGIMPDALAEIISDVDIIAMDLKLPSSTQCRSYWDEHEAFLKIASTKEVFIKTVISAQTDECDLEKAVDLVASVDSDMEFIVQPNYFEMNNGVMKKCLDFQIIAQKKLTNVKLLPQIHKFMKLR